MVSSPPSSSPASQPRSPAGGRLSCAAPGWLLVLIIGWPGSAEPAAAASGSRDLTVATWNLEWLVADRTGLDARRACATGRRPRIPCDVAVGQARDSADIAALASRARRLDADVVAFQEVEDAATAARVFRGYDLCLAGSAGVQDVGFAVRRGLRFACGPHLPSLALGGRSRAGAGLVLFPGTSREVRLLAVHLKSGCPTAPLEDDRGACGTLASQAAPLARWIRARVDAGERYAVLGDFNRDLRADAASGTGLWARLAEGGADIPAAAVDRIFRNCYPGQPFSAYIDHILPGRQLHALAVPGSFHRATFDPRETRRHRLSDHCPVRLTFSLPP